MTDELSWTHPMCDSCWRAERGDQAPARATIGMTERCAWCGHLTVSGIYVREDPATLPYPAREDA